MILAEKSKPNQRGSNPYRAWGHPFWHWTAPRCVNTGWGFHSTSLKSQLNKCYTRAQKGTAVQKSTAEGAWASILTRTSASKKDGLDVNTNNHLQGLWNISQREAFGLTIQPTFRILTRLSICTNVQTLFDAVTSEHVHAFRAELYTSAWDIRQLLYWFRKNARKCKIQRDTMSPRIEIHRRKVVLHVEYTHFCFKFKKPTWHYVLMYTKRHTDCNVKCTALWDSCGTPTDPSQHKRDRGSNTTHWGWVWLLLRPLPARYDEWNLQSASWNWHLHCSILVEQLENTIANITQGKV